MKSIFYGVIFIGIFLSGKAAFAQSSLARELNVPVVRYPVSKWNASWITCQDASVVDYNVALFRKVFALPSVPDSFIIHLSADNQYRLFINGSMACLGPQLSDIRHWRYETIDISRWRKKGKNIIAAEVINWGPDRFFGIISAKTGLLIQGNSSKESIVNTGSNGWKAYRNKAFHPWFPNWMYGVDIIGGFYASNPGDNVEARLYPWDWKTIDYDGSGWLNAAWLGNATS